MMNSDWWKRLETVVANAAPKIEQGVKTAVNHLDRAVDVAAATWEKEQIPQKVGGAWKTAKDEWANRTSNSTHDRPKPKP